MSNAHNFEASTSAFLLGSSTQQHNNKYRAYASAVDKALKSFENTTEWADLIAALVKLGKVFSSHSKTFNDIPNSLTVAKRLAQCLHPALPHGVHVKALETYRQVFLILGRTQNLARYFFLYTAGLFPLMDHCGIKVKSELLSIFEQFFLPLGIDLCPALPGLITALLLALEEGTEFYGRAFTLIDQLIEKVGTDAFYICFWQAVAENPSARLPALIFINAKIEKRKAASDFLLTIVGGGQATNHMLKALCAVGEDSGSPLVQRHLLDFLCTALPLNSNWVSASDFVQLLRRCIFVVLRRDMSLNRRLYQWLLNRSNDVAFAGLPIDGKEDSLDLAFFKKHTLPLIRIALRDYLQSDSVVVPTQNTGTLLQGTMPKNLQIQYPEVRVCRLFHYMLDRPELGQIILENCLPDLLETCCIRDQGLLRELQTECENLDPGFGSLDDFNSPELNESIQEQNKRSEEIKKNFNALLKSLEPNFLWNYFEQLFSKINKEEDVEFQSQDNDDMDESDETLVEEQNYQMKRRQIQNLYPLMIIYSIKNVQLDSHAPIRGRYLPELLRNILSNIQCDAFSEDNIVAIIVSTRYLLAEITQNNVSIVFESIQDAVDTSPSKKNVKYNKDLAEEQKLVESSLDACLHLLSSVCEWYTKNREREKIGVLISVFTLVRDFADFPFYSLQPLAAAVSSSVPQSPCRSLTDSIRSSNWLQALVDLIDPKTWKTTVEPPDFDIRARLFDLLIYLSVRSLSMIEQHSAVFGRAMNQKSGAVDKNKKTTTTVLLKPFFSQADLNALEENKLLKDSAAILWERFSECTEMNRLHTIALLLLRLHSRKINDPSSEVEDIIISELTSTNKSISGLAARKFRELWVFCRSLQIEEVYRGIPLKPMNRVVIALIGFIADESVGAEQIELRALAYSWFQDCARNNDLHKILQMLTLILLNPSTARVSIQFVQMQQRFTKNELSFLPEEINCVLLTTVSGKQAFYHVCRDIDARPKMELELQFTGDSWSDYNYINSDPKQSWVTELNKSLQLPSTTATSSIQRHKNIDVLQEEGGNMDVEQTSSSHQRKTHNRTLSDIPQFDNDVESMDSFSMDTSFDQEVVDTLQFIIDAVCNEAEENTDESNTAAADEKTAFISNSSDEVFHHAQARKTDLRERHISSSQEADEISVVGSLITPAVTAAALPRITGSGDTIKRIRTGHRRQDSLQESIFSTGTQELRLFDPTELPNSTCPGDHKQPLLDETFSHMLFYVESPSKVDLGRAEKLFRTIDTLLKSGVGRQIVSCMLFTNIHNLISNNASGGASSSISQQLLEFMAKHYRHIQGAGFWDSSIEGENSDPFIASESKNQRFSTLFEIFSTVILYFFRSYFLNSPTNYVSEDDLILAWKCKIAAIDCFGELLCILDGIVRDTSSKEFATFVQHIYRQTKAQKVVLTLMLAAIPTPAGKGWRMPLTMDIAEFNNGLQQNGHFRDIIYAYHRSLLNLASSLVALEHNLLIGNRSFTSHQNSYGIPSTFGTHHQITENQINYNSSQNRSTIREARYSVVELRLFLSVIINALKRCPERHELWLQFLISILPYLDRALATFVVHITEQICRNLYDCIFLNNQAIGDTWSTLSPHVSPSAESFLEYAKTPLQFVDYRITRANENVFANQTNLMATTKYPANYILILMESLMSVLHFSSLDNNLSSLLSPQMLIRNAVTSFPSFMKQNSNPVPSRNSTTNQSSFSSANMTSMVGSAISVIPGTGLINNLFGRVFTSGDSSLATTNCTDEENAGKTPEWLEAQRELLKRMPSVVAILTDIWSYAINKDPSEFKNTTAQFGTYKTLAMLILEILNPIAKKHKNVLINSLGIVWMFRAYSCNMAKSIDQNQCTFTNSPQQINIVKLALRLKALSLNSIIISISETLKEIANKIRIGANERLSTNFEISLLEFLYECTKQVPVNELKESWSALNILFTESPLAQLSARATFLEFMILTDFVRRCGIQTIHEDRYISKAILEICQKLVDGVNSIIGWQLESTTWLKRTLVVRQDAANQKSVTDLSPVLDQKGVCSSTSALGASAIQSETNSIRGSTISLSVIPSSRLSVALDIQSTSSGNDTKKNPPSLRSSLKDTSNKKDPSDSTQAIFLLAENLTELVDSITRSEDKERLLPMLQLVWNNTLPYLKSKSAKNVRSFLASSKLLASMSSFNYMRPIWKKNAMELLWDNAFFKMDINALKQWLIVIDNLMTNDKTSFKELLARITTSTSTTLSTLITSKEQEYEMRSQYLKRLSFVILSSELDQYSQQLNEIQERLTENLRLCQAPIIHTQVFTCYRVLLIRMSPSNFVSIWPSMITELIQVMAQIEQYLCTTNHASVDEQKSAKEEQIMQLFLAGCKLLETLCTLPSGHASQFQMSRWTFIAPMKTRSMSEFFVPYATRINSFLTQRYGILTKEDLEIRPISLFNIKTLTSVQEMHPLFFTLAQQNSQLSAHGAQNGELPASNYSPPEVLHDGDDMLNGSLSLKSAIARIENSLYVDFAEHWQL